MIQNSAKNNLNDVTALITVRIDSPERKANLLTLIKILSRDYQMSVYILEVDRKQRIQISNNPELKYTFVKDEDPIFHRTKYLGQMQQEISTPFFAIWDLDAIVIPSQVFEAVTALRRNKAIMSFPFDGRVNFVDPVLSALFRKTLNYNVLTNLYSNTVCYYSIGALCFLDRIKYLEIGGENLSFSGWGFEDNERVIRMELNDLPIYRANGCLYHLFHPRKQKSWYKNTDKNRLEYLKVCKAED